MYSKTEHKRLISLQKIEPAKQTIMSDVKEICPKLRLKFLKRSLKMKMLFYMSMFLNL